MQSRGQMHVRRLDHAVKPNLRKTALKRHYADLQLVACVFSRPHSDTRQSHSAGCERQVSQFCNFTFCHA